MPLSSALPGLEAQIYVALKKAHASKNAEAATRQFAQDLARAIHAYTLQATVNAGQAVVVAGPAAGSTVSPGTLS